MSPLGLFSLSPALPFSHSIWLVTTNQLAVININACVLSMRYVDCRRKRREKARERETSTEMQRKRDRLSGRKKKREKGKNIHQDSLRCESNFRGKSSEKFVFLLVFFLSFVLIAEDHSCQSNVLIYLWNSHMQRRKEKELMIIIRLNIESHW